MATPRELRRLAFQLLFQLDACAGEAEGEIDQSLDESARETGVELEAREKRRVLEMARGAFRNRAVADRVVAELAPTWPSHRQPAADRNILRLAHYEMVTAGVSPKTAVNEAVELAKRYGTEKSPAFVNGVLDKVLKAIQRNTSQESLPG